ncbi:hypothetical protein AB3M83_06390 [Microbacterium sp. 179-B 1A2 NHS]|uniref:hypothetical protein n=1 Tax=Microbacterium sp. 179-B 1A2 NHS TaxID=3142383 RepID=UPI0039A2FEF6
MHRRHVLPALWWLFGAGAAAGAIMIVIGSSRPVSLGWFAYQPLAEEVFAPPGIALIDPLVPVGAGVLAAGLIGLAFLAGRRVGMRARRDATD